MIPLLLLGLVLGSLPARDSPGPPPEPLQPCDYASASGDWVLHVDPSERHGAGPARYRMTRRGRVLWENEQPFTFREAFVTHDGNAVGYAYTSGLLDFTVRKDHELVFALLGSDGTVWAEEHTPFVTQFGFQPHPRVSCIFPCPDIDLVVLEVFAQPPLRSFEWWVYSLTSGACLEKRGTRPEFLPPYPGPRTREAPSTETLFEGLRRVELLPVGSLAFGSPGEADWRNRICFQAVDPFDRLLFVDPKTGVLHALDRTGRLLFVAQPDKDDLGRFKSLWLPRWVAVRRDGALFVREASGLVEFTPHGLRVGRTGDESHLDPRIFFLPHDERRWETDGFHGKVSLIDEQDRVVRTIERGANDRWLRRIRDPVVGGNGYLALLDEAYAEIPGDLWLHCFDSKGVPLGSLELPPKESWTLAFDGERFALLRKTELIFVGLDGTLLGCTTLTEHEPYPITFAPDGELWVFEDGTMHRYRVQ